MKWFSSNCIEVFGSGANKKILHRSLIFKFLVNSIVDNSTLLL